MKNTRIWSFVLLLLFAVALFGAETVTQSQITEFEFTGTLNSEKDGTKLTFTPQGKDQKPLRLVLAPAAALDSLGLSRKLLTGKVMLNGEIKGSALIVRNLKIEGEIYSLRSHDNKPLWHQPAEFHVASNQCISCRLCPARCPVGAITMTGGKAKIDPAQCTECGICIEGIDSFRGCPVGAIKKQ